MDNKMQSKGISFPEKKAAPLSVSRKVNAMKTLAADPKQGVVQGQPVKPVVNDMKMMAKKAAPMAQSIAKM